MEEMKKVRKGKIGIIGIMVIIVMLLSISANGFAMGDIDRDGVVRAADARKALRAAVELEELSEEEKALADIDKDGKVTAADARKILRIAVGLDPNGGNADIYPWERPEWKDSDAFLSDDELRAKYSDYNDDSHLEVESLFRISKARVGLTYYSGRLTDYEDIPEGEMYIEYIDGGVPARKHKPYSPGNEPPKIDFTICQDCGKKTVGPNFEPGCTVGGCSQSIVNGDCPYCGLPRKAHQCHTCP